MELREGAALVGGAAQAALAPPAPTDDAERLKDGRSRSSAARTRRRHRRSPCPTSSTRLMSAYPDRRRGAAASPEFVMVAARERARHGAWYELFPRSASPDPARHGTLRDVAALVPDIAELGFDVLYLPPIHPIGQTSRKGPNNATTADAGRSGEPVGDRLGGRRPHRDPSRPGHVRRLRAPARGAEAARDGARPRPRLPVLPRPPVGDASIPSGSGIAADGTIRYAENPPKKYEDIYPIDFETKDRDGLWRALLDVVLFWVERGVPIFRVDNPHTKPFAFWEWLLAEVKRDHPDVLFLSEAFTRPRVMERLAKIGFDQSYTYFTWRGHEGRADGVPHRAHPAARPRLPAAEPVAEHAGHPHRPAPGRRPACVPAAVPAGGDPRRQLRHLRARVRAHGARRRGSPAPRSTATPRSTSSGSGDLGRHRRCASSSPRVNQIRREHPALQHDRTLRFHPIDNDQLLAYSKSLPDGTDRVVGDREPRSGAPAVGLGRPADAGARDGVGRAVRRPGSAERRDLHVDGRAELRGAASRASARVTSSRSNPPRRRRVTARARTDAEPAVADAVTRGAGRLGAAGLALVPGRRDLRAPRAGVPGQQRRRRGRLRRARAAARSHPGPRRDRGVAAAVLPLAAAGRRLRHRRVQGDPPRVRDDARLPARCSRRRTGATSGSSPRS